MYLARTGADKAAIRDHVTRYYPLDFTLDFTLDAIRDDYAFDVTCAGSVPQAMEAFLEAESFEDALRGAVSMAGAVAAAFYGIPRDIRDQAMAYLDGEVYTIYDRFSRQY